MTTSQAILRMRQVIRRQHKAIATEEAYVHWLRRYMEALKWIPNNLSSEQKLEHFLTDLAVRLDVSASTQNQAFNAIVYFYKDVLEQPLARVDSLRATRPAQLRHAPTIGETQKLLSDIRDVAGYPTNLIARLMYGCGLRVSEPLNLRIKDVDLEQNVLFIRGAKGGKDRVVSLPCSVAPEIDQQIQYARSIWQRDVRNRIPLEIQHQLGRKYPEYRFSWQWAWLFPSRCPCKHPRTGEIVRYRMHEANVQRAIKDARRRVGIMVLPHELRHAYATHNLNRGVNIKALQEAMGHKNIETTIGYCHAEALSVPSPLELTQKN